MKKSRFKFDFEIPYFLVRDTKAVELSIMNWKRTVCDVLFGEDVTRQGVSVVLPNKVFTAKKK